MAADGPTHPSSDPWTNGGFQLERDIAARINYLRAQEEEDF